jgi:hypothetical protein
MRKFLYSVHFCLLFVLVTTTLPSILQAQLCVNTQQGGQTGCNRSSTTTTVEIAPTGGTTAVSVSPYSPGTYFRIPVLAGGCYTIGTCGAPFDMQINCYQGLATTGPFAYDDDSGPLCGGLQASQTMQGSMCANTHVYLAEVPPSRLRYSKTTT